MLTSALVEGGHSVFFTLRPHHPSPPKSHQRHWALATHLPVPRTNNSHLLRFFYLENLPTSGYFFLNVYYVCLHPGMYVHHVHSGARGAPKRILDPRHRSYNCWELCTLETEPGSSVRAASANHCAILPLSFHSAASIREGFICSQAHC